MEQLIVLVQITRLETNQENLISPSCHPNMSDPNFGTLDLGLKTNVPSFCHPVNRIIVLKFSFEFGLICTVLLNWIPSVPIRVGHVALAGTAPAPLQKP